MSERIQKLLAAAGLGSRRGIEAWIVQGRISVNGRVAKLGERAGPTDEVLVDGRRIELGTGGQPVVHELLLYNKPVGEVTTRSDPQGRPTVFERLPAPRSGRWVVVGRLDVNTSGLLLFTTDGALAHRLMHPSSELEREYVVRVRGAPPAAIADRLERGVILADGPARFDRVIPGEASGSHAWYRVVLHEGRNREVRRLWEAVGYEVSRLTRVRYGTLTLPDGLRPGQWAMAGPAELAALLAASGSPPASGEGPPPGLIASTP
jgi:23S rRNA pseudouridine2605 synthase